MVWHRCLVGFFPGFKLPYFAMNSIAHRIWKRFDLEDVTSLANGFTMFHFKTKDDLQKVIENGPWMFGGKAIILQKWHSGFVFDMNKITKIPVWIQIYDLPFPLWTKEGLNEVASMVGQPLSCDELTLGCKRLDYARLCVEVDASLPFVHKFELEFSTTIREVHVNYEWKSKRCERCHVFGHSCQPSADKQVNNDASPSHQDKGNASPATDTGDKQVNGAASPSHQGKGNASAATDTNDKQVNGDASPSHQGKGNAITSTTTDTDEMSSEDSDSSAETNTDSSDETDTDESASDSSAESQLKPSDIGDVNSITPLSTNDHVRTLPLELPLCTTSKQMSLPSSETSSTSRVPTTDLPKLTPSRARPPESLSVAQSVGCDDNGFTLVTRRKKKKDIPEMKTWAATHRVAPSFLPSRSFVILGVWGLRFRV